MSDADAAQRAERKRLKKLESQIFTKKADADAAAKETDSAVVQLPPTNNGAERWAIVPKKLDPGAFFGRTNRAGGGYVGAMENSRMRPQGYRGGGMATRGYGRVRD